VHDTQKLPLFFYCDGDKKDNTFLERKHSPTTRSNLHVKIASELKGIRTAPSIGIQLRTIFYAFLLANKILFEPDERRPLNVTRMVRNPS
jgi:hypothetical protein